MGRAHTYGYLKERVQRNDLPNWLAKHKRRNYIIRLALSTPEWRDRGKLNALSKKCDEMTKLTGRLHVLDHEIPISHPYVCGLTVHNNMRVIDTGLNQSKSNNLTIDLDLRGQLTLI